MKEAWADADAYEAYVGRWSRQLAPRFLAWADLPPTPKVLDVGCGTGALSQAALDAGARGLAGIDVSTAHVEHARHAVRGGRAPVEFQVADAQRIPHGDAEFDAAVSGLVLNFVPKPAQAVAEMRRVVRPGGRVAAYVWDYAGKMEMMRHFWDAAAAEDPRASALDEGRRFPLCAPGPLKAAFQEAGLADVETSHLDQPTVFQDFEAFWRPFLGGQGPAPQYLAGLDEPTRRALREDLRGRVPSRPDGSVHLVARAWAVRGTA